MTAIFWMFRDSTPTRVDRWFRRLQLVSAAAYSLMHGANDAQKTMGIITGALVTGGYLDEVRSAVLGRDAVVHGDRPRHAERRLAHHQDDGHEDHEAAAGRADLPPRPARRWRSSPRPQLGVGISTTHTITGAIVGVGATRRLSAVRWGVAGQIVWAWVLTIPASATIGALRRIFLIDACSIGSKIRRPSDLAWVSAPLAATDREQRAAAVAVGGRHVAAVQLDQVPHDRQPEARAARIARARSVDAIEPLEDARQIALPGCPGPRSATDDVDHAAGAARARSSIGRRPGCSCSRSRSDCAATSCSLAGSPGPWPRRLGRRDRSLIARAAIGSRSCSTAATSDAQGAVRSLSVSWPASSRARRSRSRTRRSIRSECRAMMLEKRRAWSGGGSVLQRLDVAANGRERRAQFVRHVGDEVAPHLIGAPQIGDVVQHEHGAAAASRATGTTCATNMRRDPDRAAPRPARAGRPRGPRQLRGDVRLTHHFQIMRCRRPPPAGAASTQRPDWSGRAGPAPFTSTHALDHAGQNRVGVRALARHVGRAARPVRAPCRRARWRRRRFRRGRGRAPAG